MRDLVSCAWLTPGAPPWWPSPGDGGFSQPLGTGPATSHFGKPAGSRVPGKLRHVHTGKALPVRGSGASLLPAFLALRVGWEKGTSLPLSAAGLAEHPPAATELYFDFGMVSAPFVGTFSWSPWQRPWLSLRSSPLASHTLQRALRSPSPHAQTARQLRNLPLPLSRSRRHFQRGQVGGKRC